MNVAIYPRKSKADDKSTSMSVQIDMCMDYLNQKYGEKNYRVTIYDGDYGITGHSTQKRKDFLRMMNDVRSKKIQLVVIQRFDRIARNTRDFCNLYHDMEIAGCELVSVSQQIDTTTPYGKNFMYMQASMAELEWALTSERRKDSFAYAVKIGKWAGSNKNIPLGYKAEKVDGIRKIVKDEKTSCMIEDIFDYYLKYHNTRGCTRYINNKYNTSYCDRTIGRILKNKLYLGEYRDNNHFCEPYITHEQYDVINKKMPTTRQIGKVHESIFGGLLICPCCKKRLSPYYRNTNNKMSYRCRYSRVGSCDFRISKAEYKIEKMMLSLIERKVESYKYEINLKPKKNPKIDKSKDYKKELDRLNTMYQKGRIDDDYYDSEYERLITLIKENEPKSEDTSAFQNVQNVFIGDWKELYQELDTEHKKMFWRQTIKEIHLDESFDVKDVIFL